MSNSIRPTSLNDFVGQPNVRRVLTVMIAAAKKRGEAIGHTMFCGGPGLGKSSLSRIIAAEMGGRLVEMVGSTVKHPSDMTHHLMQLKANDVLFLDELHALPRKVEEVLYGAMEDGVISVEQRGFNDLMKQLGVSGGAEKSVVTHRLPQFTLIGATTMQGLVTAPLRSRFRQILELQPYSTDELQRIVSGTAAKLNFTLPDELALEIARRSRGTARIAIGNLLWFRDCVQGDGGIATAELLRLAFEMKGIDEHGLMTTDRKYLRRLVDSEEAVGLETIASVLGESVETITDTIEPHLMREGFVSRTPRGRTATQKARNLFEEVPV